jgi:hypothetical protein
MDRCAIEEYPTASGPADYALCLGGRIVAIVEAKKLTLGPQNVLSQAERYSKGISQPKLQAGVTAGETCPLLLAFVGREPSDEAAVWEYGAADCRAIASGGIAEAAGAGKSIQSQKRTEGCLTKSDGKAAVSSCGTRLALGQMGPRTEPKNTLGAGTHRYVSQITDKLSHAGIYSPTVGN